MSKKTVIEKGDSLILERYRTRTVSSKEGSNENVATTLKIPKDLRVGIDSGIKAKVADGSHDAKLKLAKGEAHKAINKKPEECRVQTRSRTANKAVNSQDDDKRDPIIPVDRAEGINKTAARTVSRQSKISQKSKSFSTLASGTTNSYEHDRVMFTFDKEIKPVMERNSKEDVEPSVNLLTGLRAHVNSMYAEFLKAKDSNADTSVKKSATGGLKFTDLDRLKSEVEEIVTKINEMNIGESKALVKKSNKNSISSINSVGNEENQLIDSKKFVDAVYSSGNEIPKLSELKTHLSGGLRQKIRVNKSHYIHLYRRIKKYKLEDKFGKTFEFGNEISSEIETEIIHGVARDPEGDKKSTEAFLQQNIDVILGPVFKALKLHNPGFTYNRNSAEVSMTKGKLRPDYCLTYLNKMLVFKGEEKKKGSVRKIAQELTDKMKENKIGIPHHLPYMLGYATAGYNVLLVAIDHTNELIEVSDILDIRKLTDRITLMQSLLNISIIFSQMTKDLNFC